ncbi:MAG: cell division protein [Ignavibacteriales bacterium]|nr:cell division protein [Ignavibacteriales bacterium]
MRKYAIIIFFGSLFLLAFGSYLVMSASSSYSQFRYEDQFFLFNGHILKALLSVVGLVVFSMIPYKLYKPYSKTFLVVAVVALFYALLFAPEYNGATRWIDLGFISFQPAEIARLALFIHLAALIEDKGKELHDFQGGFLYILFWVFLVAGLVALEPNVSNAAMILAISMLLLFVAGARLPHLGVSFGGSLGFVTMVAMMFSHARSRVSSFVGSVNGEGEMNMQVKQAVIGLGAGGLTGVGFGHSAQRNLFLPEAYSDFIFAILGEETGFLGAGFTLSLYVLMCVVGALIAKNTKDRFGQLLAFAVSLSLGWYALVNASVASGILPTTGLPLPLISHGGTSMFVVAVSMGILINIALTNETKTKTSEKVES